MSDDVDVVDDGEGDEEDYTLSIPVTTVVAAGLVVALLSAALILFGYYYFNSEIEEARRLSLREREELSDAVDALRSQVIELGDEPVVGPAGEVGPRGPEGDRGPRGPRGERGPAIASFTFSAFLLTYECTDEDGDGAYTCVPVG